MSIFVLDRSAIVAVIRRELGAEKVLPHLYGGLVSVETIADLLSEAARHGSCIQTALERLKQLQLEIVPFSETHAVLLAELSSLAEKIGITRSDLAVLSLAAERKATILTANEALSKVKCGAKIRLFRKAR